MAIKHPFASVKADGGDTTLVQPSNWNANHTIDAATITYAMIQNVTATDKLLGRSTAGAGVVEEIALTAAGRALIDDADATAQRTTLGLGTMATQASTAYLPITGGDVTGSTTITHSGTTGDALRITLSNVSATGNALVVDDSTNPDATPFVISASGVMVTGSLTEETLISSPQGGANLSPRLQILGTSLATSAQTIGLWAAASLAAGPSLTLAKSRGATIGSYAAVVDTENLGFLSWQGVAVDGAGFVRAAAIQGQVDGTPTAGFVPGSLVFKTSDSAGTLTTRLVIGSTGTTTITGTLACTGTATAATPTLSTHLATKAYVDGAASGGIADGDKGDITVSGTGTVWSLSVNNSLDLPDVVTPATPAVGTLRMFAKTRANRATLNTIGPSGVDVAYQPAFFGNTISMWMPSATTGQTAIGTFYTARNVGTGAAQSTAAQASTNGMLSMKRATFGTGTTATGSSGTQTASTVAWRGNAANLGGFFFGARFGIETLAADQRVFVGLSANNAAMAADASTWNNTVGLEKGTADSVWQLLTRNGTTATRVSSTCTVTAGQVLDFYIFAPPNGTDVCFRLVDAVTGTIYVDDVVSTSTLPVSTVFLYMQVATQSVTGLTAKILSLNKLYLETDL